MTAQITLSLAVILPMLAALLIRVTGRHPNLREAVTLVFSVAVWVLVVLIYQKHNQGLDLSAQWIEFMPGLTLGFQVEPLGLIFALVASTLWIVTSVYSIGYMRGNAEKHQTRFFMLFPLAITAALGIAFASNLLTLFVFYEMMTLSTFPLVTHKGNEAAMKAGRVYLGVLLASSILLFLPAIIWVWVATGTTTFTAGGVISGHISGVWITLLGLLFTLGIGKAAVMPIHKWLPAAMVAPTPVSALLHAVAVVKAGVFSLLKVVVYIIGIDQLREAPWSTWLLYLAFFTVLVSSVVAWQQDNLKRRLAYSTISQLSYVVMSTMLLTPLSVVGAAFHIAAHAFGKITLFFAAGSIYTASKKTEISQLNGIGHRMPWTMAAFAIGGLSMIGIPPAVGFVSKWYILMGTFESGQMTTLAVIFISTLLNAAYFVPIVYRAFFLKEAKTETHSHGEAPMAIVLPLVFVAIMTLVLFFYPQLFHQLAIDIRVN